MKKYKIIRFYADESHPDNRKVQATGLTLKEAKEWCKREDTHEFGVWFDGYTEHKKDEDDEICIGCGEPLLEGQSIIKGENRHAVCS